jgi:hypothetical protein
MSVTKVMWLILLKKSLLQFQHGPLQKLHIAGGGPSTPGNIAEVFFCEVLQCIGYTCLDAVDCSEVMYS